MKAKFSIDKHPTTTMNRLSKVNTLVTVKEMWWAQQEGNSVSFKCPGNKINFKDAINKKYRNGAYYWFHNHKWIF